MQYEKVGFQACVEDALGAKIGEISLVDPIRTKFPNGDSDYITHTFTGTAPSDNFSHHWEFDWMPPANFEGQEANVYVASILSNDNNQNTGDVHVTNHHTFNVGVSVEEPGLFDFSVYQILLKMRFIFLFLKNSKKTLLFYFTILRDLRLFFLMVNGIKM